MMGSSGKILLGCVFLALVLGGLKAFTMDPGEAWSASHALPRHHRLERSDLSPSKEPSLFLPACDELIGKYLRRAKKKGEAVKNSDVEERPDLAIPPGHLAVFYSLEKSRPEATALIKAGSWVRVCSATARVPDPSDKARKLHCIPSALEVLAVYRDGDRAEGWLALSVPATMNESVGTVLSVSDRFLEIEARTNHS